MKIRAKIPRRQEEQPGPPPVDKDIFLGKLTLKDDEGLLLGVFNLYAAREDLTNRRGSDMIKYNDATRLVSSLENWNGHDGADFGDHEDLYAAVWTDEYHGEWFIPTTDMLEQYLLPAKAELGLRETFNDAGVTKFVWYWSCSHHWHDQFFAVHVEPPDTYYFNQDVELAVRLVRMEPA